MIQQGPLFQWAQGPRAAGGPRAASVNVLLPHDEQNGAISNGRIEYRINVEFSQMEEMGERGSNAGNRIIDLLFFLSH